MRFISYAQNREDVILYRALAGQREGFYIDVGANDPTVVSLTRAFYDAGWHGINIEPVPAAFQRLAAQRPRDINLNVGLSNGAQRLRFYECLSESTLSTFVAAVARQRAQELGHRFRSREVPVLTLAEVCRRHAPAVIDFLSIDAENHEREVLEGHDWGRWRPRVVVVEDGLAADSGQRTHAGWEPLLLAAAYRFAFFDGLNRFYVRQEDAALLPLLQVPANITDEFVTHERLYFEGELARLEAELDVYRNMGGRALMRLLLRKLAASGKRRLRSAWPGRRRARAA